MSLRYLSLCSGIEAAEQALRDRRLGIHANTDALLRVIANLLIEHKKAIGT